MSKYLYILDPGHGGINPSTGKYVTPGKRSPKFDDGSQLFEGVNNRIIVEMLHNELEKYDIDSINIVDTYVDVPLNERVRRANELGRDIKCVYISIHSDAFGNGSEWTSPSGISVFTSKGQTRSDKFAENVINELICNFGDDVKWRLDNTDKDKDKEANFYVLRKTSMPAILCELGFHTNKEEATKMLTKEWKDAAVKSIVDAIKLWEIEN